MGNWHEVKAYIEKSNRNIILFEGEEQVGREQCLTLNIPEKTLLYEIVCNSSGIIIDNWIRIMGQTNSNNGIEYYNKIIEDSQEIAGLFIVASDILGGLFAININRFEDGKNNIWYFAPDTLEWENLAMKYSDFISWALQGNIDDFYEAMRWDNWNSIAEDVSVDQGILVYPFLWAKECDVEKAEKKVVPFNEIIALNFDYKKRLFG
ncbi:DUF2625 family protein [Butyrivibrio sp. INlla21]|uniref:DUF2625 family protein n=1 Tax=Butyrivibrio sp. INlla21 TaxID=1520811 RepID=UPI0008E24E83|nr:DUF2625 family protein [Butyrivibrio sp. INlla21]SFV04438.1 Protein of unknown function DUF2625 [Butyrivibrio sp. INlla21]